MGGYGGGHYGYGYGYRRHYFGNGYYGYGLGCQYYTPYGWSYSCTY
jgi:hypothetical protein